MEEEPAESLAATLEARKLAKYDDELEKSLRDWISNVLGSEQIKNQDQDLHTLLKDGVLLCELLNKLVPGAVPKIHKSKLAFKHLENIQTYNDACQKLGFSPTDCFSSVDLYENKDMLRVLQNLNVLSSKTEKYSSSEMSELLKSKDANNGKKRSSSYRVPKPSAPSHLQKNQSEPSSAQSSSTTKTSPSSSSYKAGRKSGSTRGPSPSMASSGTSEIMREDMETKAQFKFSKEVADAGLEWIEAVLDEPILPKEASFHEKLKSGVVFCKLINKLLPEASIKYHKRSIAFMQMENIKMYQEGCKKLGLTADDMFLVSDLFEGKNMSAVANHITRIAKFCESRPAYSHLAKIKDTSRLRSLWEEAMRGEDAEMDVGDLSKPPDSPEEQELVDWVNKQFTKGVVEEAPRQRGASRIRRSSSSRPSPLKHVLGEDGGANHVPPEDHHQSIGNTTICNLSTNTKSGVVLIALIEELTGAQADVSLFEQNPTYVWQYISNAQYVLKFLVSQTFEKVDVQARHLVTGDAKEVCRLVEYLREKFDLDYMYQKMLSQMEEEEEEEEDTASAHDRDDSSAGDDRHTSSSGSAPSISIDGPSATPVGDEGDGGKEDGDEEFTMHANDMPLSPLKPQKTEKKTKKAKKAKKGKKAKKAKKTREEGDDGKSTSAKKGKKTRKARPKSNTISMASPHLKEQSMSNPIMKSPKANDDDASSAATSKKSGGSKPSKKDRKALRKKAHTLRPDQLEAAGGDGGDGMVSLRPKKAKRDAQKHHGKSRGSKKGVKRKDDDVFHQATSSGSNIAAEGLLGTTTANNKKSRKKRSQTVASVPANRNDSATPSPTSSPHSERSARLKSLKEGSRKSPLKETVAMKKARNAVRQRVVNEILSTETSYVKSLDTVVNHIVNPLSNSRGKEKALTQDQMDSVFLNIATLHAHHQEFLALLKETIDHWDEETTCLGTVFLEKTSFLNDYELYIHQYNTSLITLRHLTQTNEFLAAIKEGFELEQQRSTGLTLEAFLIMPVQRIPRYILLLKELIKYTAPAHPDYWNLDEARKHLDKLLSHMNSGISDDDANNLSQIAALDNNIDWKNAPLESFTTGLYQPSRKYIKSGELLLKVSNPNPEKGSRSSSFRTFQKKVSIFLFNDLLLCCSKLSREDAAEGGKEYAFHSAIFLDMVSSVGGGPYTPPVDSPAVRRRVTPMMERMKKSMFHATTSETAWTLTSNSEEDCSAWLEALRSCVDSSTDSK